LSSQYLPAVIKTPRHMIARWVSRIISPPIVAALSAILIAMALNKPEAWFWAGFQLFFAILGPVILILWMVNKGVLSDFDVYFRQQRLIPYVTIIGCSFVATIIMTFAGAPILQIGFAVVGLLQSIVLFIINTRWKISAHSASSASFSILMLYLNGSHAIASLVLVPMVIWSRILLKRHTFWQTIAGSVLGFSTALTVLLII
jgi:membrane-associated phospholipid phosphatase